MNRILIVLLVSISLTSCYSYKIFPKEYRNFSYSGEKETAYVINPELKKENDILKQSGIFAFTNDSLNKDCVKIKLHPLKRNYSCGQPIIASAFTLGQFPVYFPDRYQYEFEEISTSGTTIKKFELQVAERFWFWDMFVIHKNFKQKAGKVLLGNYYKKDPVIGLRNK